MDSKSTWAYAMLAIVIAAPILAAIVYVAREQWRARNNRQYKTLAEHESLNAADRDTWMTGVLPGGGTDELNQSGTKILAVAQLATSLVLVLVVVAWNNTLSRRIDSLNRDLETLKVQVHAVALSSPPAPPKPEGEIPPTDPAGAIAAPAASPMQQVCANLIGRVADAYEKGESSKIGQSLEELVKRVGCEKHLAQ